MNERLFASRLRQALDASADRLPYRVTQRLEGARLAALGRLQPALTVSPTAQTAATLVRRGDHGEPSLWFRIGAMGLPALLLTAGFYAISAWDDARLAAETVDLDAQIILSDDAVPVSAYADRGFGTYLRNVRE